MVLRSSLRIAEKVGNEDQCAQYKTKRNRDLPFICCGNEKKFTIYILFVCLSYNKCGFSLSMVCHYSIVFRCGWGGWICVFVVEIVRGLLLGFCCLQMCLCVGIVFFLILLAVFTNCIFFSFTIIAEKKYFYIYTYRLNLTFSFPRFFCDFFIYLKYYM